MAGALRAGIHAQGAWQAAGSAPAAALLLEPHTLQPNRHNRQASTAGRTRSCTNCSLHGSRAVCRGWLLRLLGPVRDQEDFNRLDLLLVNGLQQAGVDTSQPPLTELSAALTYQPQQQQLEGLMKQLGIARLLRDPLSATLRLQSLLNHLPSGSNIEVLLQQEIDFYQSGFLQYTERFTPNGEVPASMDLGSRAGSGSDSGVPKGPSGSSAQQQLRRSSSSSGPLLAGRARAAAMAAVEPYMVLRNDTVRAEWRSTFGSRERITWKEFWHKLVHPQVGAARALVCWHTPLAAAHMSWLCCVPDACCDDRWPCASPRHTCQRDTLRVLMLQAHIWGLDRQLDKFTTDYVQQHLQRGSHGLLTLSEMDFAFPPNVSPAMIVQARLKGHTSVSSAGLTPVQFGPRSAAARPSKLPGGVGWLREVRLLQDPNPRLHNFPEVRAPCCQGRLLLAACRVLVATSKQQPPTRMQLSGRYGHARAFLHGG